MSLPLLIMDIWVLNITIHLEPWVTSGISHLYWVRGHFSLERNVILFLTFQKVVSDSVTFTSLWSCFPLNNARVWDPNDGSLKTSFTCTHADTASNYANWFKRIFIYSNGKAFTVWGKL